MEVLDIGCGNGATLLDNAGLFRVGVGIDNDPAHLDLAERRATGRVENVEFHGLEIDELPSQGWPDRFDLVFSERGPIGFESRSVQAALSVLRPDGVLFCECIGDLHHQEMQEFFGAGARRNQAVRAGDQVRVAMERNGVEVRIAADLITKRYYPDIYEWLQFQCSIWAWAGAPFPDPGDPRLRMFAERNTTSTGEVETTHHVVWVGGVKRSEPVGYHEAQHFGHIEQ